MSQQVILKGQLLDDDGFQVQGHTRLVGLEVGDDGSLWETDCGYRVHRTGLNSVGELTLQGGCTFILDSGELARLSNDYGCNL